MKLVSQLALVGLLVTTSAVARGFDTGHHSDLTWDSIQDQGFGPTAIQIAQVQNWLVDYFSSTATDGFRVAGVRVGDAKDARLKGDLDRMHFDNLYSTEQISRYWGHLT